jgi:HPr kinase/phosphorylase
MLVHATCVALRPHGRIWRAVLLRGPSGAGKSDLAARLIETGARLVADDQTKLVRKGGAVIGAPPVTLAGLLEVRGVGIVKLGRGQLLVRAPVAMLVDLVPPERIERMPEPAFEKVLGIELPVLALAPFEVTASALLRLALAQVTAP